MRWRRFFIDFFGESEECTMFGNKMACQCSNTHTISTLKDVGQEKGQDETRIPTRTYSSCPLYINLYLYTFKGTLGASPTGHPKLENIAIFELEGSRRCMGRRQTNVIEESASSRPGVSDEKMAMSLSPNLCVRSRNDVGFKSEVI